MPSTIPYAIVVEDDALILLHACDILEEAGFRFHEAGSGSEAISLLEEHADGVVLLFSDVDMPGEVDGFALARHVDEHWPWIEIVIASGHINPTAGALPEKATFITKPFSQTTVHDHLREKLPNGEKPELLKTPGG